jgi:hypothetical protein
VTYVLETSDRLEDIGPLLEQLEARTDAEVLAYGADELAEDLEWLVWTTVALHTVWHGATHALQAKRELLHVALRHDDAVVERQCLRDRSVGLHPRARGLLSASP